MLGPSRPWSQMTPLQTLVERACDAMLSEPNYGVNLELAELINEKKANTPRDGAMEVVRAINNRNPHIAMLALHLLDTLVKNCGYPFHLQIATKEFLNELVRRFPERPPVLMGPVMGKTLELIHEWKNTICITSKHKEDLVHIRDMHRLLSYKGYRFKPFDATKALANANPTENLKSPEELEEEDRAAKSAKLQELIRRGGPKDLALAQELMKQLSGAEPEKQPDYEAQTKKELEKVQGKAILLNDMLNNVNEGERVGVDGDAYEQVAMVCKGARPKIQKWIAEAGEENAELMDRLLLMNDLINNVLDRFEAVKKGDWAKAQEIDATLNPQNKPPDLISFDVFGDDSNLAALSPSTPNNASTPSGQQPNTTTSGLPLDLFSAFSAPAPASGSQKARQDPMAFFNTPSPMPNQQGQGQGQVQGYQVPQYQQQQPQQFQGFSNPPQNQYQQQQQSSSSNNMFGGLQLGGAPSSASGSPGAAAGSGFGHGISLPISPAPPQQQQQQQQGGPTNGAKKSDPFADLANW